MGKVIAATFNAAQIWAEILLLHAKQNYGNNKQISPDKSKQAHHKLGMTVGIFLSCQLHGCSQPVPTLVLIFIKASLSFNLLQQQFMVTSYCVWFESYVSLLPLYFYSYVSVVSMSIQLYHQLVFSMYGVMISKYCQWPIVIFQSLPVHCMREHLPFGV